MVADAMAPAVIAIMHTHTHTHTCKVGDGRIFALHVKRSILIRAGQHENGALPATDFYHNQDLSS